MAVQVLQGDLTAVQLPDVRVGVDDGGPHAGETLCHMQPAQVQDTPQDSAKVCKIQ